jgi:hypothetical protein
MMAAVEAHPDISDDGAVPEQEPEFALERQDAGQGCRWSYASDGAAIGRASRVVTLFAAVLFVGSTGVLFFAGTVGSDNVIRVLSTAWIAAIILALAAAHWRAIAGEPLVLEVQPAYIELYNPAFLWGRRQRWPIARVRKMVIAHRGKAILTGRPVGNLYVYFRWRSRGVFNGLEVQELQDVAERIHAITGMKIVP